MHVIVLKLFGGEFLGGISSFNLWSLFASIDKNSLIQASLFV
jgi:hypothetical protein